ncbi:MAG: gamma carbonic anhydrase family protein [Acidimicrobiales bacterium]
MPIYSLNDLVPNIDKTAFVHRDAIVIGSVEIGREASVWPGAVLRGDYGRIVVGPRTSVQDGTVVHADRATPTVIGAGCVIGHLVHLEGCLVEDACLIASGATVLAGAIVRRGATVAAGAVVTEQMEVPEGRLAIGVPARIADGGWSTERIEEGAALYTENARRYASGLRRIG